MTKKLGPFKKHSWFGKRYNLFGEYLRDKFKHPVLKIPINAGLSCPNRDGTLGTVGCSFCSENGSSARNIIGIKDIKDQMDNVKSKFTRISNNTKFISYFQSYTNTHAPNDFLKNIYTTAIQGDEIIGLMIGTRPDCLPDEILELISSYINYKENFELWLEIGVQSSHEKSLKILNRKHTFEDSKDAIIRSNKFKIKTCIHIILGIPNESWDDMMATANEISRLPINGVKIHHMYVIKGTPLENYYKKKNFYTFSIKEYVSTLCDFIERLRGDILVHRIIGDHDPENLIAPNWGQNKGTIQNMVDAEFLKRETYQGFLYEEKIL